MKKRVLIFTVIFIINIIMFTGCWDYREIDNLSIVAGVAVDKNEQGQYVLTVEVVDMHEGGKDVKVKSKLLEVKGDTFFDAARNIIKITAPKLYWGHTEIVIFSQDVAREGIIEILDWLSRDAEPRLTIDLLVSREDTAKEIFDTQSIISEVRSYEINDMLKAQTNLSKAPKVKIYDFISALSSEGVSAILSAIKTADNKGEMTTEISGTAVFKGDKLIGFLDEDQTKNCLFVMNKIKGGAINIGKQPEGKIKNISLEIVNNKTKVKPVYSNGEISMNIDIKTETDIIEHGSEVDFVNEEGYLVLKEDVQKQLKSDIESVIRMVQQDFDVDIFGFGKTIKQDMPDLWKKIGPDWENIFRNLEVNINVKIEMKNSGRLGRAIKIGD